jgi:hypothetical protein
LDPGSHPDVSSRSDEDDFTGGNGEDGERKVIWKDDRVLCDICVLLLKRIRILTGGRGGRRDFLGMWKASAFPVFVSFRET